MIRFELWKHTLTKESLTLAVLPMKSHELIECDIVKARKLDDGFLKLEFLQTAHRKEGRGTVLMHAAAAIGLKMGLSEIAGPFGPAPGMSQYCRDWYLKHGVEIQNGMFYGALENIFGNVRTNYEQLFIVL